MENPASVTDLQARWHPNPLDDADAAAVAQTRLDEAWRALQRELPNVVARVESDALDVQDVIDVLSAAALRILRNPEGHTQGSVSIDDYSETWKADEQAASIDLYFTRAELRRLSPRDVSAGAFTIRPTGWSCPTY